MNLTNMSSMLSTTLAALLLISALLLPQPGQCQDLKALQEQVGTMINSDPKLKQDVESLKNDPNVKQLLNDPSVEKAVRSMDLPALLSNPNVLKLLNHPTIKGIRQKAEGTVAK